MEEREKGEKREKREKGEKREKREKAACFGSRSALVSHCSRLQFIDRSAQAGAIRYRHIAVLNLDGFLEQVVDPEFVAGDCG